MGTTPPNFHTFPEVLSVWPGLAASSRKQLSVPRKGITRRGCTSHKQFCEFALPALEFILPPSQGSTSLLICHWPPASATGRGVLSITEVRLLTLPLESLQLLFPTYFPFFFSFSPQMQIAISFLCKIRERKKKAIILSFTLAVELYSSFLLSILSWRLQERLHKKQICMKATEPSLKEQLSCTNQRTQIQGAEKFNYSSAYLLFKTEVESDVFSCGLCLIVPNFSFWSFSLIYVSLVWLNDQTLKQLLLSHAFASLLSLVKYFLSLQAACLRCLCPAVLGVTRWDIKKLKKNIFLKSTETQRGNQTLPNNVLIKRDVFWQ